MRWSLITLQGPMVSSALPAVALTLQMNDFQLIVLDGIGVRHRRRVRIVTAAAILVACAAPRPLGMALVRPLESRPNYDPSLTTCKPAGLSMYPTIDRGVLKPTVGRHVACAVLTGDNHA